MKRMPERVRADLLGQACPAGDPADDSPGAMPVKRFRVDGGQPARRGQSAPLELHVQHVKRRGFRDGADGGFICTFLQWAWSVTDALRERRIPCRC
jgi:hypothetical protein